MGSIRTRAVRRHPTQSRAAGCRRGARPRRALARPVVCQLPRRDDDGDGRCAGAGKRPAAVTDGLPDAGSRIDTRCPVPCAADPTTWPNLPRYRYGKGPVVNGVLRTPDGVANVAPKALAHARGHVRAHARAHALHSCASSHHHTVDQVLNSTLTLNALHGEIARVGDERLPKGSHVARPRASVQVCSARSGGAKWSPP